MTLPDLPAELLDRTFAGRNLDPGPLGAQLRDAPTLLVLIRHFG
jgi:hypothetical protein